MQNHAEYLMSPFISPRNYVSRWAEHKLETFSHWENESAPTWGEVRGRVTPEHEVACDPARLSKDERTENPVTAASRRERGTSLCHDALTRALS